jgi:hypothetical protein
MRVKCTWLVTLPIVVVASSASIGYNKAVYLSCSKTESERFADSGSQVV